MHFRTVFAELAPGGKAELVMHKRLGGKRAREDADAEAEGLDEDEDAPAPAGSFSDRYSGVGVKASPCLQCILRAENLGHVMQMQSAWENTKMRLPLQAASPTATAASASRSVNEDSGVLDQDG